MEAGQPRKKGRPKIEIDYQLVEKLASIQCTITEIASVLEISHDTLQRDKHFCVLYKKAIGQGKMSLRRKQMEIALKGNSTMLVWCGKQYLDQSESPQELEIKKMELELRRKELEFKMNRQDEQVVEYEKLKDFLAVLNSGTSIGKTE
jgi:uncharacterized protein YacL (UPF0231 family)